MSYDTRVAELEERVRLLEGAVEVFAALLSQQITPHCGSEAFEIVARCTRRSASQSQRAREALRETLELNERRRGPRREATGSR